jgi:hypothetical protein
MTITSYEEERGGGEGRSQEVAKERRRVSNGRSEGGRRLDIRRDACRDERRRLLILAKGNKGPAGVGEVDVERREGEPEFSKLPS